MGTDYRLSNPDEESRGIDGYIGDYPVSIKPLTYEIKSELTEHIGTRIVYYKKLEEAIEVNYSNIFG